MKQTRRAAGEGREGRGQTDRGGGREGVRGRLVAHLSRPLCQHCGHEGGRAAVTELTWRGGIRVKWWTTVRWTEWANERTTAAPLILPE